MTFDSIKPREKALEFGIKTLSDAELMAIIFGTGIKGKNVIEMCADILRDNDMHISKVARMDVREFMQRYKGIGPAKALTMLAALELGNRSAADALVVDRKPIRCALDGYTYMKRYLDGLTHEEFWFLMLKNNNEPIRAVKIGQGGMTATLVDMKVLFRDVLTANAPVIMLFHNHPSGNMSASAEDKRLTAKISEGAKLLDIKLIDHIIVGCDCFFSFHDEGLM